MKKIILSLLMLFSLTSFSKQAYEKNIVSSFFIVDSQLTGSNGWVLNFDNQKWAYVCTRY